MSARSIRASLQTCLARIVQHRQGTGPDVCARYRLHRLVCAKRGATIGDSQGCSARGAMSGKAWKSDLRNNWFTAIWIGLELEKLRMQPESENDKLARAWIEEISINAGIIDPNRTYDTAFSIDELIENNPAKAWLVITSISWAQMSSWAEENFSAGPLTSFVVRHGSKYSQQIRELACTNPEFEMHLSGVVFQDDVERILRRS